jgi:hypothetical protein
MVIWEEVFELSPGCHDIMALNGAAMPLRPGQIGQLRLKPVDPRTLKRNL